MAFTVADLADFHRFAEQKLSDGRVEDIDELTHEWRELRGLAEDIRQAEAEIEAGEGQPLKEAFADVRRKLGWSE